VNPNLGKTTEYNFCPIVDLLIVLHFSLAGSGDFLTSYLAKPSNSSSIQTRGITPDGRLVEGPTTSGIKQLGQNCKG